MSIFFDHPLVRPSPSRTPLPPDVVDFISRDRFEDAANSLFRVRFPVYEAFRVLANCPKVLIPLLYKQSSFTDPPYLQQIVCHLYLQAAIPALNFLPSDEVRAEREKIQNFIATYKGSLSQSLVRRIIVDSGQTSLLPHALEAFGNYEALATRYLSADVVDHAGLKRILPHLSVPLQRQVFLRCLGQNAVTWIEYLNEHPDIPIDVIFDGFASLVLTLAQSAQGTDVRNNTRDILQQYYAGGQLRDPAHLHLYLITMVLLGEGDRVSAFLESPDFARIETDFVASFLRRQKQLKFAAKIYARVPGRHVLAVTVAYEESPETAIEILEKDLGNADDKAECWSQLLDLAKAAAEQNLPVDWARIASQAHIIGRVSLDQIFRRLPVDLPMDKLDETVSAAVKETSGKIQSNRKVRQDIETQARLQREKVAEQISRPVVAPPAQITCFFCGNSACDSGFVIYSCKHAIHVSCGVKEYPGYDPATKEQSLRESCPACGLAALRTLTLPFIDPDNAQNEFEQWDVPL
jgi:hypothetical protein